jgi:hypothetical protein
MDSGENAMNTTGVMRGFAWAVGMLVGVPTLAYLALVAVNWNDEPPSADVERLVAMNHDRPVLADGANGYVHVLGLADGPDADPGYRDARSPEVTALADACGEASACAEALDARPGALAHWLDSEQWLLDRYRRMLATTGWREPIPADPLHLPAYQPAMEAQKLHLLDARRQALAGDPAAVRDLLERDLLFWRQVLASSDLLITKMVAAAAVRQNFVLGNLALRELPAGDADAAVPPSWRQPLTVAERSLMRPFGGEWHVVASAIRAGMLPGATGAASSESIGDQLVRPLYQEQATLNLTAARMVRLGTLSELPYPQLGPALEGLARPEEQAGLRFQPYNPVGAILDSVAADAVYADYIARASDVEGLRRATLLVASLRGEGVGREGAAAAVREAPMRSPYDGAPFEWDAASGSVVFDGLASTWLGRHAVLF